MERERENRESTVRNKSKAFAATWPLKCPFFFPFFFCCFSDTHRHGLSQYLPCQRGCPCGLMLFVLCGSLLADRLSWANINLRWLLSHVKLMASMALSKLFQKQSGKKKKKNETKRKTKNGLHWDYEWNVSRGKKEWDRVCTCERHYDVAQSRVLLSHSSRLERNC